MKVLISDPSGYKAIVIAKQLKRYYPNTEILGLETKKLLKIYSKYFSRVITYNIDSLFKSNMKALLYQEGVSLLLITNSDELLKIFRLNDLELNSLIGYNSLDDFEALNNKALLAKLCSSLNISAPSTLKAVQAKIDKSYVAKPILGSSSKGVIYFLPLSLESKKELMELSADQFIIQEYIEGFAAGLSVYAKNGEIFSLYSHKRLLEYPVSGGSSVYRCGYHNDEMMEIAKRLLNATKWTGFAMFEFKVTKSGNPFLIEVNPRIWGSINQGLANGVNYFECILGESVTKIYNAKEIRTYLSPIIYKSLFKSLMKGKFYSTFNFLSNFRVNRADVSFFDDPFGFLSMLLRKL